MLKSINPYTMKTVQTYQDHGPGDVENILDKSHSGFIRNRLLSFSERGQIISRVAELLRREKTLYAELMAREMGKPLQQGIAEAEKCAWLCDYYLEHAETFLSSRKVETDARKSYVSFEPLGVILAIMPWNFPFWQVFRAAVPALLAGNAVVLKHSSNVCGCALAIEDLIKKAEPPEGLFQTLLIESKEINPIIEHPLVKAVTLTGSTQAGRAVAAAAGNSLKKTVLELGGSDPYVILEDADLEKTVETCVTSRLINSGQSCIAAKRFIVVESIRDNFLKQFVDMMSLKKMGDPLDPGMDIGPLARIDLRDELHKLVDSSVRDGATVLLGGNIPETKGVFYPPTVLSNVTRDMPVFTEETFGPVASVVSVNDEAEAIAAANDTNYGLGAAVFTEDIERGELIARREFDAGCCCVNTFVKSDPRLPFGGIKQSGYGRELSEFGIQEFVNIKTVLIQ